MTTESMALKQAEVVERKYDYAEIGWKQSHHHKRWRLRVENRKPQLICQECRGEGGYTEAILWDGIGGGPFYDCGWCEGTGLVDSSRRALWLYYKRLEKDEMSAS